MPGEHRYAISAVIPAYNAAGFIAHAVRSVLAQTYPAHEIIVVDDGSTDETAEVVEAAFHDRVRLVRKANGGVSSARNAGMRVAAGEYIAFLDADDAWHPQKLEAQVAAWALFPECGLCYTDVQFDHGGTRGTSYAVFRDHRWGYRDVFDQVRQVDLEGWPTPLVAYAGSIFRFLMYNGMVMPSSAVVERSLLENSTISWGESIKWGTEDSDFFLRLSALTSVSYIDAPLVRYRDVAGDAARLSNHEHTPKRIESFLEIIRAVARETGYGSQDPEWVEHCLAGQYRRLGYYHLSVLDPMRARLPLRASLAHGSRRLSTFLLLLATFLPAGVIRKLGRIKTILHRA